MRHVTLAICVLVWSACTALDQDPDYYIEPLRPDVYFALELPHQTAFASVRFQTTETLASQRLRVITWANEGGNIYDHTLGETTLSGPTEANGLWQWTGGAVPPPGSAFDKIGLQLLTPLHYVAFRAVPTTGAYALVDFAGAGITYIGEWLEAILQLWVQCRGVVQQLEPCHGLSYVLAPAVQIYAIAPGVTVTTTDSPKHFAYMLTPNLYLKETPNGWLYRAPAPGEYANWKPIDAHPTRGPFDTADAAVRDAARTLGLTYDRAEWEDMLRLAENTAEMKATTMVDLFRALRDAAK
ncbi:hypothetical protein [Haliangium ochraceum]|uniref:Lipoprotein n=1 Tax=Haliangium ochraceum (strain DSM 14365 / JCM 11303 / SMP-2) TaxID=502025 RepID=D0LSZ8_HALO1|nr:hypothetical protein [Haliangium ochraceum]ACY19134.1 hypothetical protein Hoch_6668 [Haliangium ochraceum DSM 14365]